MNLRHRRHTLIEAIVQPFFFAVAGVMVGVLDHLRVLRSYVAIPVMYNPSRWTGVAAVLIIPLFRTSNRSR